MSNNVAPQTSASYWFANVGRKTKQVFTVQNLEKHVSPLHWFKAAGRKTKQAITNRKVKNYIHRNNLRPVIEEARAATSSTGANDSDYVLLHSYVRSRKPKYVLECGTGLTTWIIAEALRQNWMEAGQTDDAKGLVVSIEEDTKWYDHAAKSMDDRYRPFIEFVRSEREYFHYSFLFGVTYKTIPDYPYELMFVDGPVCRYFPADSKGCYQHTAALDLVKLLLRRDLKLTVLVDNLKRTQMAFSCLFRTGLVKHYRNWSSIGVLEDIRRSDLLIDTDEYISTFRKIVEPSGWQLAPSFCKELL